MITQKRGFNPSTFLTTSGSGRKLINFTKGQPIYAQGDAANSLFVIQNGSVKLSIKSQTGKEAILDILSKADFVGKDSLSGVSTRTASASALTDSRLLRITKEVMLLALKREVKLANVFWAYLLACNIRYQQDLVDQHCNLSEKRLARILLRLSHYDSQAGPEITVPAISHEILAEMVGTTRSRICFFMNRFRKLGFIYYEHKSKLLRVHQTLLVFCAQ
jgi:CRP/FNR family transcriptional regulator, cyclic AMP receptor protein